MMSIVFLTTRIYTWSKVKLTFGYMKLDHILVSPWNWNRLPVLVFLNLYWSSLFWWSHRFGNEVSISGSQIKKNLWYYAAQIVVWQHLVCRILDAYFNKKHIVIIPTIEIIWRTTMQKPLIPFHWHVRIIQFIFD